MIHFAYPNAKDDQFIGCGRYAAFLPKDVADGKYVKAEVNIPDKKIIDRYINLLVPDLLKSEKEIYESRDEPDKKYQGTSLVLAYVLASINCSREIKFKNFTGHIWCTGVLSNMGKTILLENVDQSVFDIKVRGFLSEKNEDRLFIVPAGNFKDLSGKYQKEIKAKNIKILSVDEFKALWDKNIKEKTILKVLPNEMGKLVDLLFPREIPKKLILCCIFMILLILAVGIYKIMPEKITADHVTACLENGDFIECPDLMNKISPDSQEAEKLKKIISTPVKPVVKFQFQKAANPPSELYDISPELGNITLSHNDNYRFKIFCTSELNELYLYVFQKDFDNYLQMRFPDPVWKPVKNNPVPIDEFPVNIPPDDKEWMYLDEISLSGMGYIPDETFYIIAAPWKAADIEMLYGRIHQETNTKNRNKQVKEFVERLMLRESSGFACIFFREFSFRHGEKP
ncbi:Uncharacterized protein dnl_26190 [Desulfonema limicola]|uniref:DUF4384 domain-containing protein n=1 Tax=Desulfonema limicola TaxID=45656 RepID=A0A975B7I1_9BACT|nr:hypothetical protein [Desulfonema limicola]QTA80320.1 Uncharacterized protein dnl_26190 [Desulfonema limicola]